MGGWRLRRKYVNPTSAPYGYGWYNRAPTNNFFGRQKSRKEEEVVSKMIKDLRGNELTYRGPRG